MSKTFAQKIAGKFVQNTVINASQISCSGCGLTPVQKDRVAQLLLSERKAAQKFWEAMESSASGLSRHDVMDAAFAIAE